MQKRATVANGRMKSTAALAVAAILSMMAASAGAAPSSRLVYAREQGADGCPDISAFRKAVAARVGYDPFFPWAEIAVTAEIRRTDQRVVGRVSLVDGEGIVRGSREMAVANGDCAELVSSMALAVAIALDSLPARTADPSPASGLEAAEPSEPPHPPDAPEAPSMTQTGSATDRPARDATRTADPRKETHVVVGAGVLAAAGWAPAPTAGLTLMGGVRWRFLAGELEARADLPAAASGPAGGGVRSQLLALTVLPCLRGSLLFGCAAVSAARIGASGFDVAEAREASALFVVASGRVGVELPLTRSFLARGYTELGFPLARPTLRVAGADAWRPSMPSFSLGVALVLQIP